MRHEAAEADLGIVCDALYAAFALQEIMPKDKKTLK